MFRVEREDFLDADDWDDADLRFNLGSVGWIGFAELFFYLDVSFSMQFASYIHFYVGAWEKYSKGIRFFVLIEKYRNVCSTAEKTLSLH